MLMLVGIRIAISATTPPERDGQDSNFVPLASQQTVAVT
jgi:hypothetical protein